jgi:hypothetical protein
MSGQDDIDYDYDSGPFCRHWRDPADCNLLCKVCRHFCWQHSWYVNNCNVEGCSCEEYKDDE